MNGNCLDFGMFDYELAIVNENKILALFCNTDGCYAMYFVNM